MLEDDLEQLQALRRLVEAANLEPLATASPRQAMARLEGRRPILAIRFRPPSQWCRRL